MSLKRASYVKHIPRYGQLLKHRYVNSSGKIRTRKYECHSESICTHFYHSSISSISLRAPFRYIFSILVALSLRSLWNYDACAHYHRRKWRKRGRKERHAHILKWKTLLLGTYWWLHSFLKGFSFFDSWTRIFKGDFGTILE